MQDWREPLISKRGAGPTPFFVWYKKNNAKKKHTRGKLAQSARLASIEGIILNLESLDSLWELFRLVLASTDGLQGNCGVHSLTLSRET